ncbi:MAG: hypothetical protein KC591_01455 [Gemmatimonadetes bacterium]|nr:hypothetical protein [Gemmatimonadota bacterium]
MQFDTASLRSHAPGHRRSRGAGVLGLAALVVLLGLTASSARALEHGLTRESYPAPEPLNDWQRSGAMTVSYYNLCTGWSWVWNTFFYPNDSWGVMFDVPDGSDQLLGHWEFMAYDSFGRGYVLTTVGRVQGGVVDSVLAYQSYYPSRGWNYYTWEAPISGEIAIYSFISAFGGNSPGLVTDRPAIGPDGSGPACGTCYPIDREVHSRYSFTSRNPFPNGLTFEDGSGCHAELVYEAVFASSATDAPEVESLSWGRLRRMFR